MATMAALRGALAEHFDPAETRTVLLRLREAGTLPAGTCGRAGSAEITVRHAALALIALSCGADPIDAPAEAQRIAAFRLLRRDRTHASEPEQRVAFENQHITLLAAMVNEIERCDEDRRPSSWRITAHGANQIAPDRLVFGPSLEALVDPSERVERSCRIPGRLLGDVGELFHAKRAVAAD
jgi:hypothetical protein